MSKSPAEERYWALVMRLSEIEVEVEEQRGLRRHGIYLTDGAIDWENTADSTDLEDKPLVEGTDEWWQMMYAQAASNAGDLSEEQGIDINSYFAKPIY
jgi:hypothetical protein